MIDLDRLHKTVEKKGNVKIGAKEKKATITNGSAKLIIHAKNCPEKNEITTLAQEKKIPVYSYKSNSVDLGVACGKSYAVSSFAVINDGNTNIMQIIKKRK